MKNLLVLEENESIRELIKEVFAGQPISLVVTSTIAEAKKMLEGITFDAAIIDCYIAAERSDTGEILRVLLGRHCHPVIAISGHSGRLAEAMALGCHIGYLKPMVTMTSVVAAVMNSGCRRG